MAESQHTPLPWAICVKPPNDCWYAGRTIYDVTGDRRVADTSILDLNHEANAEFIVRACNNYGLLLEALDRVMDIMGDEIEYKAPYSYKLAKAAIKKAQGE